MSIPSQCNILDLNDYCFYEIYTFLPITDWCSLRDTCTRFRTISDYCFDRQRETFELKHIGDPWYDLDPARVKRVIRHFGRFMETLTINKKHFGDAVDCNVLMLLLDRYCPSLLDLELIHFDLTFATIQKCSRLLSNLQRFVIDDWGSEETVSHCLTYCTSLKELELIRLDMALDCLASSHIDTLETFKMSRCYNISYEPIKSFLVKNSQLKQVKLFDLGYNFFNIVQCIADKLPTVETLSLDPTFTLNLTPVLKMSLLKKLEMTLASFTDTTTNQILRGLSERNNIEELLLARFECTAELVGILSTMRSLKKLTLVKMDDLNGHVCTKLATGLKSLDEIQIAECDDTSFSDVQQFCVHLPHLKKIVFNRSELFHPSITQEIVTSQLFHPSITQEIVTSLIEIRRNQEAKEILLIFLNDDDLRKIKNDFKRSGMKETLTKQENILKMVALQKEHRSTLYEYGNRPHVLSDSNYSISDESEETDMSIRSYESMWLW